jgi:hypothetical protein
MKLRASSKRFGQYLSRSLKGRLGGGRSTDAAAAGGGAPGSPVAAVGESTTGPLASKASVGEGGYSPLTAARRARMAARAAGAAPFGGPLAALRASADAFGVAGPATPTAGDGSGGAESSIAAMAAAAAAAAEAAAAGHGAGAAAAGPVAAGAARLLDLGVSGSGAAPEQGGCASPYATGHKGRRLLAGETSGPPAGAEGEGTAAAGVAAGAAAGAPARQRRAWADPAAPSTPLAAGAASRAAEPQPAGLRRATGAAPRYGHATPALSAPDGNDSDEAPLVSKRTASSPEFLSPFESFASSMAGSAGGRRGSAELPTPRLGEAPQGPLAAIAAAAAAGGPRKRESSGSGHPQVGAAGARPGRGRGVAGARPGRGRSRWGSSGPTATGGVPACLETCG